MYVSQKVCQKHYFRMMRNGTYETVRKPIVDGVGSERGHSAGYVLIYVPNHPLSQKCGQVYKHRYVMYEKYGEDIPPCEKCGSKSDWSSRKTHIDHIDEDRSNNCISNLRVLCNGCNVIRTKREYCYEKSRLAVTFNGVTKTPNEWGREDFIKVEGHCIRQRIKRGYSDFDALFSPKKTHTRNN